MEHQCLEFAFGVFPFCVPFWQIEHGLQYRDTTMFIPGQKKFCMIRSLVFLFPGCPASGVSWANDMLLVRSFFGVTIWRQSFDWNLHKQQFDAICSILSYYLKYFLFDSDGELYLPLWGWTELNLFGFATAFSLYYHGHHLC